MGEVVVFGRQAESKRPQGESEHQANGLWCAALPVLSLGEVVLREVRESDAPALVHHLTTPEITRFISPPPSTVDGFGEFITASQRARAGGEGACFAVTLRDQDTAIGLFQIRLTSSAENEASQFSGVRDSAEWGFAVATPYWGTGIFLRGAALVLDFVFEQMRVHRLEARCALKNGRGGKALVKVGAVPEGILRKAFTCGDEHLDQVLYAIVDQDWRASRDRTRATDVAFVH
ncbi:MAG: GNAT family protein [Vicinamibacterales bacterium]